MLWFRSHVILICLIFSACSAPVKDYSDQIFVKSVSYKFIDELFLQNDERNSVINVPVWVSYPDIEKFSPPYPAVVLLHSSWGFSAQESFYANKFKQLGIAVFAIDSFTPRGVRKTSTDQSLVSSASMIKDAYQVLEYLHTDYKVNAHKVAVMGFSKGGIVAFYSAFDSVNQAINENTQSFAAHIAYYPWCGIRLHDMSTTGMPILIQGGEKDVITPVKKCQQIIDEEFTQESKQSVIVKSHPKARHAFDHPILARVPFMLALDAQVPAFCDLRQDETGEFTEIHSNEKVTGENIKSVLEACSTATGNAGSHRRATKNALEITTTFLKKHLID